MATTRGISLGILGTGSFAQCFIPLFQAHPLVASVALCDHQEDRLRASADRHGIGRTFSSYEDLLASDVEAVAVFTQHWMHAPQVVQALSAGKDAYSAVPMAASRAELDELMAAVRARPGAIYMMGETSAYYAEAIHCRERFARGEFGSMVYAQAEYLHDWDHGLYAVGRNRGGEHWRSRFGNWFPMAYPTHSLGMALSVTRARALSVACVGVRDTRPADRDLYDPVSNPFSNEVALFALSDGSALRIMEARRIGHPGAERMSLYGTEGCFERTSDARLWTTKGSVEHLDPLFAVDHADTRRRSARLPEALRHDAGHPELGHHGGSHPFLVDDFVKACAWRLQPRVNAWQAARYLLPGLVAHDSAMAGGVRLEIPDYGDGPEVDVAEFERPFTSESAVVERV